ncbi:ulp1 protease family protein [Colletotrichum tofieldiae]|nr:ulp1 protease family protein [Colletotrichum tofieldiae]
MPATATVQSTLEELNLFVDSSRRRTDPILSVWRRLRDEFNATVADAASNHVVDRFNKHISSEALHRLSANLERWSLTQSVSFFYSVPKLHKSASPRKLSRPSANAAHISTSPALSSFLTKLQMQHKFAERKSIDRLKEAILHRNATMLTSLFAAQVCPTAWPRRMVKTTGNEATSIAKAASEASDDDSPRYQLVEDFPALNSDNDDDGDDHGDLSNEGNTFGDFVAPSSPAHNPNLAVSSALSKPEPFVNPGLSTTVEESPSLE